MKEAKSQSKTSKEIIGSMIATRRKNKKVTQQELASLLEVDRQYIWRLEKGKVNLTMDYLDKVIKELSCIHEEFLVIPLFTDK
ncbi:MAG TPA: helix-turn-helix transcriptional regulator [Nitrosopumilaceae archaeon]|jgi:transcriptional regulator with XRE-family HTH domain|nr:helix-turn-helix transcriptional regulator [Nitrosopumilaceae archaeon]